MTRRLTQRLSDVVNGRVEPASKGGVVDLIGDESEEDEDEDEDNEPLYMSDPYVGVDEIEPGEDELSEDDRYEEGSISPEQQPPATIVQPHSHTFAQPRPPTLVQPPAPIAQPPLRTFGVPPHIFTVRECDLADTHEDSPGYLFRVTLPTLSPPQITRILRVPSTITFHQFHLCLQAAFGWQSAHVYEFAICAGKQVKMPRWPKDKLAPLPRFDINLLMLLKAQLQPLEPWEDQEDAMMKSSMEVKLRNVFERRDCWERAVTAQYLYDAGDNWRHTVSFLGDAPEGLADGLLGDFERKGTKKKPLDQPAYCIAVEGRPCVENYGLYPGFEEIKRLFKDPSLPNPGQRRRWYRRFNKDDVNPWEWSIDVVNKDLKKLLTTPKFVRQKYP